MTIFLRVLRQLVLCLWVGGLMFFAFAVTPVAFKTMPDAHHAGLIVRGTLLVLHRMGLYGGALYLLATLALLALQHDTHPARAVELVLVISMLLLTAYSQLSVLPHMEVDRLTLGGEIAGASPDAPARKDFDRLHSLSVKLEGAILVEGLVLLVLSTIHGRDNEYDRFA